MSAIALVFLSVLSDIMIPIAIGGGIALILGVVIVITAKFFDVPVDEKLESIKALLPGANCGACGFSGCEAYADALAQGEPNAGRCPVGGPDMAEELAELLYPRPLRCFVRVRRKTPINAMNMQVRQPASQRPAFSPDLIPARTAAWDLVIALRFVNLAPLGSSTASPSSTAANAPPAACASKPVLRN
jgi:hypothetical protein